MENDILQDLSIGVIVVDPLRKIAFSNPAAGKLLGCQDISNKQTCHRYIWGSDLPCVQCPLEPTGISPLVRERELPGDGRILDIEARIRKDGTVLETIVDITVLKGFQREMARAALIDPTSGLFKRQYIRESLQRELLSAHRKGIDLSLLLLRVPRINVSDISAIPRIVARVLRGIGEVSVNPHEHSYRFGRDTFAIILPEYDLAVALSAAGKLRKKLTELGIDNVKIGISTMGEKRIADALIHSAQLALYQADHSDDFVSTV